MNPDIGTLDIEITINPKKHQHPRGRRVSASKQPPAARIPRITRLMALAIKFQGMVDGGEVRDYADLARLGYVSRARITQIMNLLNLAPDIQEQLLFLDPAICSVRETHVRRLVAPDCWSDQREHWNQVFRHGRSKVLEHHPKRSASEQVFLAGRTTPSAHVAKENPATAQPGQRSRRRRASTPQPSSVASAAMGSSSRVPAC